MKVTWNHAKNLANQKNHGITFEEARELFTSGVDRFEFFDEAHSDLEDRFISIGPIRRGLVVWTERDENVIRIISARWATRREKRLFLDHFGETDD